LISVTAHGSGYTSDPKFTISDARCKCNGLAGTVAGNFDACLSPRRAHGASLGSRVAHSAVVQGYSTRVYLTGLSGVQNPDSLYIPLQRHGFNNSDGTAVFGMYGRWIKASNTLVLQFTGPTMNALEDYAVEFYLLNPSVFQSGPSISIYTTGITSAEASIETAPLGSLKNALSIAGFYSSSIASQSNPAQNGTNEIRLVLIPHLTHPMAPSVELLTAGENYAAGDLRIFDGDKEISTFNSSFSTRTDGSISHMFGRTFGDNFSFSPSAEVRPFYPSSDVTQDGSVRYIEIVNPGSGHADGTFQLVIGCNLPDCVGTGLSATYTVSEGLVVSCNVINRGSGYTDLTSTSTPRVYTQGCNGYGFGSGCVDSVLKARVPRGAAFNLRPPFVKIAGLTGAQGPATGKIKLSSFQNEATRVYGGEADWDLEAGSITLTLIRAAENGTQYGLSFELLNPLIGQTSVQPVITGQSGFAHGTTLMQKDVGNAAPLLVCNVSSAFISQDNAGQGQLNILTITFSLTITLYPPVIITILGLTGTAEPSQNLAINSSNYRNGTWDQAAGILQLTVNNDLIAGTRHIFSFSLTNPAAHRKPANVSFSSVFFFETTLESGTGLTAPLRVNGLLVSRIGQINPSASAFNTLTVTLQSVYTIQALVHSQRTIFVLQGLKGAQTRDTLTLPLNDLSGEVSTIFGSSCVWKQAAGALILTLLQDAAPLEDIVFSIVLQNPKTPQDGQHVTVHASQGLRILPVTMEQGEGLAQVLLVAGITLSQVAQSTPSQDAANTLTVSFACNFALFASDNPIVTIAGLAGSKTIGNKYLALTGGNTSHFAEKAYWRNNQQIEFKVEIDTARHGTLSSSFVLTNPSLGQSSPDLSIRANGNGYSTPWQTIEKAPGNAAALLVAAFAYSSAGQSTGEPGVANIITVTVAANCDLRFETLPIQLHFSGLQNATSPNPLVVISDKSNDFVKLTSDPASFSNISASQAHKILSVGMSKGKTMLASTLYVFQFNLTNPLQPQAPPDLYVSLTGEIVIGKTAMYKPTGLDAVLRIFTSSTGTSSLKGSTTTDWSNRSASSRMEARRGFGAAYLPGLMLGPAGGQMSKMLFGYQGQWYQPGGRAILSIQVGQLMAQGSTYQVSFPIDNPLTALNKVNVHVMAGTPYNIQTLNYGGNHFIYDELLQGESGSLDLPGSKPGDAQPLKVYSNSWSVVEIGQDSPFPSAVNTIHVTLASWIGLKENTIIDIWGLVGTTTTSNAALPITNHNDGAAGFASTGKWVQSNGQLTVIARATNLSTAYHFSFSLTNTAFELASARVSIEARGTISIPSQVMTTGSVLNPAFAAIPHLTIADAAPLRIRAVEFYVRACGQSNSFPNRSYVCVLLPCFCGQLV
jgi:hypothetical protein